MKTKKTLGQMTYGEYIKETCKWTLGLYAIAAIAGVIYGLIKGIYKKTKTEVTDNVTTGVFIDDATEEVEED